MDEKKRGRTSSVSVLDRPDADTAELAAELRSLFGEHPGLTQSGPETIRRVLRLLRGLEADAFIVECAVDALRVEGEVLA